MSEHVLPSDAEITFRRISALTVSANSAKR